LGLGLGGVVGKADPELAGTHGSRRRFAGQRRGSPGLRRAVSPPRCEGKASDPDLRGYLAELRLHQTLKTPQAAWPAFKKGAINLTPRTFFDGRRSVIVLGENCLGKRHVDCVSLVNACCSAGSTARGKPRFTFHIWQYEAGLAGRVVMSRKRWAAQRFRS
jgi:hypothetical protein